MCLFQQTQSEVQQSKAAPSTDEYVLDQLCICEEKLVKLMEELETSGNDVEQLMRQMEAEEVITFHLNVVFNVYSSLFTRKLAAVRNKHQAYC